MLIEPSIKIIESQIHDPGLGLDPSLFLFVSKLTPLVNVDLLIQEELSSGKRTLLTWRHDQFYRGWHVPGGIIRFRETIESRVKNTAESELSARVSKWNGPIAFNQHINHDRAVRGHFIALLYQVTILGEIPKHLECKDLSDPEIGTWAWFQQPPTNLIKQHDIYREYF